MFNYTTRMGNLFTPRKLFFTGKIDRLIDLYVQFNAMIRMKLYKKNNINYVTWAIYVIFNTMIFSYSQTKALIPCFWFVFRWPKSHGGKPFFFLFLWFLFNSNGCVTSTLLVALSIVICTTVLR